MDSLTPAPSGATILAATRTTWCRVSGGVPSAGAAAPSLAALTQDGSRGCQGPAAGPAPLRPPPPPPTPTSAPRRRLTPALAKVQAEASAAVVREREASAAVPPPSLLALPGGAGTLRRVSSRRWVTMAARGPSSVSCAHSASVVSLTREGTVGVGREELSVGRLSPPTPTASSAASSARVSAELMALAGEDPAPAGARSAGLTFAKSAGRVHMTLHLVFARTASRAAAILPCSSSLPLTPPNSMEFQCQGRPMPSRASKAYWGTPGAPRTSRASTRAAPFAGVCTSTLPSAQRRRVARGIIAAGPVPAAAAAAAEALPAGEEEEEK